MHLSDDRSNFYRPHINLPLVMEYSGKRTDIVDAGGDYDYSHVKWFSDPPARPAVCGLKILFLAKGPE